MKSTGLNQAFGLVLLGAAAGTVAALGFAELSLDALDAGDIAARFLALVMVATVIERAVEIYVVGRFGAEAPEDPAALAEFRKAKARAAQTASLLLSVAVAAVGMRVLAQFLPMDAEAGQTQMFQGAQAALQTTLFRFVDMVLSTLVLAGGAEGIHRLTRRLT